MPGPGRLFGDVCLAGYAGRSTGYYTLEYGNGGSRAGRTEAGQYFANVALTANFAASTIRGCIGCQRDDEIATGAYDGWRVEGVYVDPQTGLHETADYNDSAGYTDTPEICSLMGISRATLYAYVEELSAPRAAREQ